MARRMKLDPIDEPVEVASKAAVKPLDIQKLRKGIDELIAKREDVALANGQASGVTKNLVKDLGVNAAGLRMALGLYKATDEKRRDMLRTFRAACEAMEISLDPTDMVDAMEA